MRLMTEVSGLTFLVNLIQLMVRGSTPLAVHAHRICGSVCCCSVVDSQSIWFSMIQTIYWFRVTVYVTM